MEIKIWGCRGSLPVPGPNTLKYGGNTTCLEIRLKDGRVLIIDAGSGMHGLGNQTMKEGKTREACILMTHAHWDHLIGFPFFGPAYDKRFSFRVCGGLNAQESLIKYFMHEMEPPYFPVTFWEMRADFHFNCEGPCNSFIKNTDVKTIPLNHPNGGKGFKIMEEDRTFIFLTDNELSYRHPGGPEYQDFVEFCRDADILIHDAQYTDKEYETYKSWGHSTFSDAIKLGIAAEVKKLGFFHHGIDRTDEELDKLLVICKENLKKLNSSIECFIVADNMTIDV